MYLVSRTGGGAGLGVTGIEKRFDRLPPLC
jgi:hypothetical protein